MDFRQIDVHDDAAFARHYEISQAADAFERPYHTPWSLEASRTLWRLDDPAEHKEAWGAFDGEEMVGSASFYLPLLDNTSMVWIEVAVEPARRRNSIGSGLLGALLDRAREHGRTTVLAAAAYPADRREGHPYRLFAEQNGFALANTEVHRILELPADEGFLRAMIEEAAPHHTAYRIERFVDTIPNELLPSYCDVQNQLGLDAPTGDIDFEAEQVTPEIWLERDAQLRKAGRTRSTTLATDAAGNVVAYSDIMIPADEVGKLHQWGTLVHRDHRGHRLGLALKALNLLEVQRNHPDRTMIHTGNAEVNGWMVSINERLGFRPVELFAEFQRILD